MEVTKYHVLCMKKDFLWLVSRFVKRFVIGCKAIWSFGCVRLKFGRPI